MNATDGLSSVKGTGAVYTLVLFLLSVYTNVTSFLFILDIYPFLKSGHVCVNSSDESFYMGDSNNGPVQLITSININSYLENVGTTDPDLPAIDNPTSVTVGTTISWAGINWVISHKTDNRLYLTSMTIIGTCSFYELPDHCTDLANTFTNAELSALVDVSYGNTSGRVFVASYSQMRGGLNYFRSNENRIASYSWGGGSENMPYWTSTLSGVVSATEYVQAYYVSEDGAIGQMFDNNASQDTYGFRPSVCIDLTLYK